MCQTDPFRLYLVCLNASSEKLEGFHHKDENDQQRLVYLRTQAHRLEAAGLEEDPIPTLENKFA